MVKKLSARQQEIFNDFVHGLDEQAIADKYTLSIKTIGTHLDNIKTRLNVHSRKDLCVLYIKILETKLNGSPNC